MEELNVIEVEDVKKFFRVYLDKSNTFKEKVIFRKRERYEERKVLDGISFQVKKGEAIGLIGHNGCGKSTTLKLLTRIIYPDSGNIKIKGRVSSLIELGAGFHPDMSGRENIYINASIFGLTRKEIDKRVDDIITFSELEEYIENPVRTYSSGMYMRLAFSVAINVDADVLLIDEILAVGDVNFQQKCFEKLKDIKKAGTTIVIVSHSLSQIEQICERSIWLDKGEIRADGRPKEIHEKYLGAMEKDRMARIEEEARRKDNVSVDRSKEGELKSLPDFCSQNAIRRGNQKVEFTNIYLINENGERKNLIRTGECVKIHIDYKCKESDMVGTFGVGIYRDNDDFYCFGTNTDIEFKDSVKLNHNGTVEIVFESMELLAGKYNINIASHSKDVSEIYDYIWNVMQIQVFNTKGDDGLVRMRTKWLKDGEEIGRV